MKVALITDQHFGSKNGNTGLHDFFEKFYSQCFFPYLDEHNITEIIDLGDTFDKRKSIDFDSLARCRRYYFDEIANRNIRLHMIIGNHCLPFLNLTSINSPKLLLGDYSNIIIYDQPQEVVLNNTKILFLPWINQETYDATNSLIKSTDAAIVFGHLEIAGFEMYQGYGAKHGILSDIFQKFKLVCSGHFHHKSSNRNISYLGCPYEMSWADYNDPKGFHIFDTETGSLEFIPNPFRMFYKIFYDDLKWSEYKEHDTSKYTGTIVKVIVINKNNADWFDKFERSIRRSNPLDCKFEDVKIQINDASINPDDLEMDMDDTFELLHKAVEATNMTVEVKADLHEVFKEIYLEAMNSG